MPDPADAAAVDRLIGSAGAVIAGIGLAWLTVITAAALLARLPGAAGRAAACIARVVTPALARRLVVAGAGAVVTLGPALPATADDEGPAVPSLDRPTGERPSPAYVVRPGDCLWSVARRHLRGPASPASTARSWPRWYAANRAVIGPDPDLIRPGQRLRPPQSRTHELEERA